MEPSRAGQPAIHGLLRLHFLVLTSIISLSCAPASDAQDRPRLIEREAGAMSTDVRTVVDGNNRFALELYARLTSGQSENLFFAPGSLSTALAMTNAGARGQTAEQMAQVLHLQVPDDKLHPAFAVLRATWAADGK